MLADELLAWVKIVEVEPSHIGPLVSYDSSDEESQNKRPRR